MRLAVRVASGGCVTPLFVLAGLREQACPLKTGISALATFELNGPTTPITPVSATSVCMLVAPCVGSWTPFTASSWTLMSRVYPPTPPLAFCCAMASFTPFAVGTPLAVSPPLIGSSVPIFSVPFEPAAALPPADAAGLEPPPPLLALGEGVAALLHAANAIAALATRTPKRVYFMNSS
jgi:hypothetical protein